MTMQQQSDTMLQISMLLAVAASLAESIQLSVGEHDVAEVLDEVSDYLEVWSEELQAKADDDAAQSRREART